MPQSVVCDAATFLTRILNLTRFPSSRTILRRTESGSDRQHLRTMFTHHRWGGARQWATVGALAECSFDRPGQSCALAGRAGASLLSLSLCSGAVASTAADGRITAYFTDPSGLVLFDTSGTRSTRPSCADPVANNFSYRADTLPKQAILASIMTAYASGRTVYITGTGTCSEVPNVESIGNLILK